MLKMINKIVYFVPSTNRTWKESLIEKTGTPPLGVALLSSILKLHGYEVLVKDFLVEEIGPKEIKSIIDEFSPNVIGVSASFSECIDNAYKMIKFIKKYYPEIPIMAGGVHSTFNPEEVLNNGADYVILGEGESSTIKLMEYFKYNKDERILRSIKGIAYWKNNEIVFNEGRNTVEDLECLPFPSRDDLKLERYATPISLITSRGCPGDCVYCASRAFFGKRYRLRNAESVFSEVYYLYKEYKSNISLIDTYMSIFDDTFTVNKVRLRKFCEYMIKTGLNKILIWKCESRIDVLDEDVIKLLSESGCIALHMGIESADQGVIDSLNKHIKVKNAENILRLLKQYKIRPLCSFIIGNHSDTHQTLSKTQEFIEHICDEYGAKVAISPNTPLPGTELFNYPEKYGITLKSDKWSDYSLMKVIIDTKNLTQDDIRNYYTKIMLIIDAKENDYRVRSK